MLDDDARLRLHRDGLHTLHDHWFASLLYGEPFLDSNRVAYFDGRYLTLCAYRLATFEEPLLAELADWTRQWVRSTRPDVVSLVTPRCPDLRALACEGLARFHTWPARPIAREVIASSAAPGGPRTRLHRRALAAPYEVRLTRGGSVVADKLRLIERFQRSIGMTPYLAGLTAAWLAILTSTRVRFVEAWKGERLCGFVALHQAFERGAVAMAMARDADARGVADFLYAHMLEYAGDAGWAWINLCSSVTRGQHAFKLKWAELSPLPAYTLTEWRRPSLARQRYVLWGPRTMQKSSL